MKVILLLFILPFAPVRAGDTYDCVNAKGDYYASRPSEPAASVVAYNSAAHEPRYAPMLDERDYRRLIFIRARRERAVYFGGF